jgi:dipeptidyl aminopeptidase/acylaminoacyl peptidase
MKKMLSASCCVALGIILVAGAAGANPHPFNVHDMVAMQRIADPQSSPDGRRVAFSVTTMDLEANKGRKDVWIAGTDGSGSRRLTTDSANDFSPRWSGNDTLYFLSTRSGSSQVWRLTLSGGEPVQITDLPLGVDAFKVGPGGGALYAGIAVFPDCEDSVPCTARRLEEREAQTASGLIFDRVFVRHWDTWKDGRRNHVFRIPIDGRGKAGSPVDLMTGVDGDCPTIPWGGDGDFSISPHDKWLVYTAKGVNGSEEVWSTDWDLWAVPTDGSAAALCLTESNQAWDASPAFSPDGTTLAYVAMARPGYEADRYRVVLMDWKTRSPQILTEDWDRSPGSVVWAHRSRRWDGCGGGRAAYQHEPAAAR